MRLFLKLSLVSLVLILSAAIKLHADVYTYRDASGTVGYVEDLGKVPAKYRASAKKMEENDTVSIMESESPTVGKGTVGKRQMVKPQTQVKKRFDGTIELYVTTWCPVCKDAEAYITKMGYPYVKFDIEKDKSAKERNDGYPGRGVPLVVVGNKNFRGFSGDTLEYYMNK